jgi:PAS domain S-box-containing protein
VTGEATFGLSSLLQVGTILRGLGAGASSMEEVAGAIVSCLREHFVDKRSGQSALPLVRCYVTKRFDELEPDVQDFARAAAPDTFGERNVVCLTLLGTAGEDPAWNARRDSIGHKAIPLPSMESLRRSPMIAQLMAQLGVDAGHIIAPAPDLLRDVEERTYNVFFVPEARDSPYVPAQDEFVIPYGIRSVVGFGGVLPDGMVFAVVLFSTVPIPAAIVDTFATIALSIKVALLDHVSGPTFAGYQPGPAARARQADLDAAVTTSKLATLQQLLDARAVMVEREALRLENQATEAEERVQEVMASRAALELSEARKTAILEGALDCIIGMDAGGHITDFNHAAETTFGYSRHEATGQVLADLLIPYSMRERHRLGLADHLVTRAGPVIGRRLAVNALRRDGTEFPVELAVTEIAGTDPPQFSGYVRDVSDRRHADAELAASRERLAHIARTLQTSLLPPSLPVIEGIELAAAFRASGDGFEVGGDFYDAFELGDGRWALILGDVCGKGSDAAVMTALARYTVRAAAVRTHHPAGVLAILNEAIHRQHPELFCTAVYAVLEPDTGTIELALGGHPHPLLLDASGVVTLVGRPNRLLGPIQEWSGTEDRLILNPGDTLLLYSDGLTEARSGREFYGEQRLAAVLQSTLGLSTDAAVAKIETSVLEYAPALSDDLAILAVRRIPAE